MSGVDVVERVRMCVAEAGYDPSLILEPSVDWALFETKVGDIPAKVLWRAREIAGADQPVCFACCEASAYTDEEPSECWAVRRLELDCGVDR